MLTLVNARPSALRDLQSTEQVVHSLLGDRYAGGHAAGEPEQRQEVESAVEGGCNRHTVPVEHHCNWPLLLAKQEQHRLVVSAAALGAIGEVFRFRDNNNTKRELVIFLTPRIVNRAEALGR